MIPYISPLLSAIGGVLTAIAGPSTPDESGVQSAGSQYQISSGGDVSSGGGNADPSSGISGTSLIILAGGGVGAFLLWKHFIKK